MLLYRLLCIAEEVGSPTIGRSTVGDEFPFLDNLVGGIGRDDEPHIVLGIVEQQCGARERVFSIFMIVQILRPCALWPQLEHNRLVAWCFDGVKCHVGRIRPALGMVGHEGALHFVHRHRIPKMSPFGHGKVCFGKVFVLTPCVFKVQVAPVPLRIAEGAVQPHEGQKQYVSYHCLHVIVFFR